MSTQSLDRKVAIVELTQEANPTIDPPLSIETVRPARPRVIEGKPKNTDIVLDAVPGGRYYGFTRLNYQRPALDVVFRNITPRCKLFQPSRVSDFVPQLRQEYGIDLRDEDYVDGPLDLVTQPLQFVLQASPDSLRYSGSVTIQFELEDPELSWLLANPFLPTLRQNPRPDAAGRRTAEFLTYGVDYTPLRAWLEALPLGGVLGEGKIPAAAQLNQVARLGFSDKPGGNSLYDAIVTRRALTTEVPYTNQAYTHVVVLQMSPVNTEYGGTCFLHYNGS